MSVEWDQPFEPTRAVTPVPVGGVAGPSRVQSRGSAWRRTARGLYVSSACAASVEQRIVEAARRLPGYGAVGGWAAAYWRGVEWLDGGGTAAAEPVLLNLGCLGKIRPSPGVHAVRTRMGPADLERVDGLWITSPVRTAFDGARLARSLTEATVFVDQMLAAGLVSIAEIMAYAAANRAAWKGVGQVRDACRFADERAASPMETRFRMLWMLYGQLPRPLVNARNGWKTAG